MKKQVLLKTPVNSYWFWVLLAGLLVTVYPSRGGAQVCHQDGDVEIVEAGGSNLLMYWLEVECGPTAAVKYQTSSDRGVTWSSVMTMVTSNVLGAIEDLDDVITTKSRGALVASFATGGPGDAKLQVLLSNDFGQTWSGPIVAWNITNDIPTFSGLGCPNLTTSYNSDSRVLTLHTVAIDSGNTAHIHVVRSLDEGQTWESAQTLGAVPVLCDD